MTRPAATTSGPLAVGLVPDAAGLDARTRRAVALAGELGAPLAGVLARAAARDDADADARRALRRATAQGRAVALGLSLAPPALAPLLGRLAGADAGVPRPVLVVAGALWLAGVLLVVRLVRRAATPAPARPGPWVVGVVLAVVLGQPVLGVVLAVPAVLAARRPPPPAPGLDELLELTALGVRTGLGPAAALRAGGRHVPHLADAAARVALWLDLGGAGPPPALPALAGGLATAVARGAPVLPLLEHTAADHRAAVQQARLEQAERLPAQLTVPTTLLLLPASLLVALAPVVRVALAPLR